MREATPRAAAVAVVSKGDPRLIDLEERTGVHFPADVDGKYAGYYPRTSEDAISQLEAAGGAGAEFLCLPATAFWWLEHYAGLAAWLEAHCHKVADDRETCIVYDLLRSSAGDTADDDDGGHTNKPLRALLETLLPEDAVLITVGIDDSELAESNWTIAALGRGDPSRFEQRMEASRGTAFVLVSRRDSDPPPHPDLTQLLASTTRPVAQRPGLCDLYEVKGAANPPGPGHRPPGGDREAGLPQSSRGEIADKLSRRLEGLGLGRQDGLPPMSTVEVSE